MSKLFSFLVGCPRFTVIQQCSENHCRVALDLRICGDSSSVLQVCIASAGMNARLGHCSVQIVIDHNVPEERTSEVRNLVHCDQPLMVDGYVGPDVCLHLWWLMHQFYFLCDDGEAECRSCYNSRRTCQRYVACLPREIKLKKKLLENVSTLCCMFPTRDNIQDNIIREHEVADGVRLNLGLCLQPPEVKDGR